MVRAAIVICALMLVQVVSGMPAAIGGKPLRGSLLQLKVQEEEAAAAAPASAPASAPAGAPSGDKKYDWSKMPLKAQEQGYSGKKVKHEDGKTGLSDWQNEYGNE